MAHFTCNFLSYALNRAVNIDVILPTMCGPEVAAPGKHSHRISQKIPVLYLLHGGINDYSTWERYTSIERYAEERRIAVVTCSAENKSYIDIDSGGEENFLFGRDHMFTFISEELPDFVTSIFPITTDREHTYMAGLSMGGYGTMLHAFTNPEKYRAIGIFSSFPTLDLFPDRLTGKERWDTEKLLEHAVEAGKVLPAIYTTMGTEDMLYKEFPKFLKKMDELHVSYTSDIVPGYAHEWAFWDLQIVKFLDWLPRTDWYYRDAPKRRI